ncbi:Sec-independent protein translocase protein TatB [Gammaproteobacteria bacterium]
MFEIGFWELVVVGIVTLLVVGPEELPGLARTAGAWIGKARYFLSGIKAEIEQELKTDELKRLVEEQTNVSDIHELIEEAREALNIDPEFHTADEKTPTQEARPDVVSQR